MVNFLNLLTIVFVVLKLTDIVDWSWWWIVSPSLLFITLVITFLAVAISLGFSEKPKSFK